MQCCNIGRLAPVWRIPPLGDGVLFAALAALGFVIEAEAQEHWTPLEWQPKLHGWNRDANDNQVEDDIEAMDPNARIDVILDCNDCPVQEDLDRFAAFGTVGFVGNAITSVQLMGVRAGDALTLANDERVAMVEIARQVKLRLNISNPAIRVRRSNRYSPNTAEDQFPTIDGTGVNIAIIDTGVDDAGTTGAHPSVAGKFVGGFNALTGMQENPDDDWPRGHGTCVAGIALGTGGLPPVPVRVHSAESRPARGWSM